jgi:hypothetical protein
MTISRSEDLFVGLVALAALLWLIAILRRGMRDQQLPVGRGRVLRRERPAAFHSLFAFYIGAALLMGFIGLDLLIGIRP